MHGAGTDRIGVTRATSWDAEYVRAADLPIFGHCGNYTSSGGAQTNCTAEDWSRLKPGKWVCDDCVGWAEDPFLWASGRGFHLLTHNLHGIGGRATPWWVGMAYSEDFVHWRYSPVPAATNTYTSTDGNTVTLKGRERPQLLLSDDDSKTPLALYSAASHADHGGSGGTGHSGTFTFVQGTVALKGSEART